MLNDRGIAEEQNFFIETVLPKSILRQLSEEEMDAYREPFRTSESRLPTTARPGALLVGRALDFCRTWKNQEEVEVEGIHYIQEDSPAAIGTAIRNFLTRVYA